MNCFGVLNLSEFYRIKLFIPIPSIFISVYQAVNLKFLELTSNYVQPVRDQHWSASAENRYHARHMPVPHQYQMIAPTTSTGPALADQCRTSLSSLTYASAGTSTVCQHCARTCQYECNTAPVVNFLLGKPSSPIIRLELNENCSYFQQIFIHEFISNICHFFVVFLKFFFIFCPVISQGSVP